MSYFNLGIIFVFVIFITKFYKSMGKYFFFSFYLLFQHIWILLSSAYLESGVYLNDLQQNTYYVGCTLKLFILDILLFTTILICIKINLHRSNRNYESDFSISCKNKENGNLWCNMIFVLIMILLIDAIISGNIISNSSINRANFYSHYSKIPIAYYIMLFIDYFMCVIGTILCDSIKSKNKNIIYKCIVIIILLIVYKFLIGVQFGGYFSFLVALLLPFLTKMRIKKIRIFNLKGLIIIFILSIFIILPKLYYFYNNPIYAGITDTPVQSLIYRAFALQGEVWWKINENNTNDIMQINNEILSMFSDNYKYDAGIYYLMKIIMPSEIYNNVLIKNGFTLASGYPAILISIFGYRIMTFIFTVLNGILYSLAIIYLFNKIIKHEYFRIFLGYGVLYGLYLAYSMGGALYLSSTTMIFCIISIFIIEICFKGKKLVL